MFESTDNFLKQNIPLRMSDSEDTQSMTLEEAYGLDDRYLPTTPAVVKEPTTYVNFRLAKPRREQEFKCIRCHVSQDAVDSFMKHGALCERCDDFSDTKLLIPIMIDFHSDKLSNYLSYRCALCEVDVYPVLLQRDDAICQVCALELISFDGYSGRTEGATTTAVVDGEKKKGDGECKDDKDGGDGKDGPVEQKDEGKDGVSHTSLPV